MTDLLALLLTDSLPCVDMLEDHSPHDVDPDVDIDELTKRFKKRETELLIKLKAMTNKEAK
jgi:hypothetical protein